MTELLGSDVADQMGAGVRMSVGMTFKAHDATTWAHRAPVLSLVELLLRERSEQQAQALELLGIQDPVEQFVIVLNGHQFTLRHVTEIGPRRQINWRRKLGEEMVGQIKIKVEAGEISPFLLLNLLDVELGEHHSAFCVVRVWKRKKSRGEHPLFTDLFWAHGLELLPGHALGKSGPYAFLDRLSAGHRDILGRAVR